MLDLNIITHDIYSECYKSYLTSAQITSNLISKWGFMILTDEFEQVRKIISNYKKDTNNLNKYANEIKLVINSFFAAPLTLNVYIDTLRQTISIIDILEKPNKDHCNNYLQLDPKTQEDWIQYYYIYEPNCTCTLLDNGDVILSVCKKMIKIQK